MAVCASTAMTSCDDNFERPPMVVPVATIEANTTIDQLKTDFFQAGQNNYAVEIGNRADGSHYIIEGYVTSSDEAGNYFKQIVIQDETSAIQIGVDAYDLYLSYQMGQKVVIDVTGLYIGAYGSLMQLGAAPTSGYPSRISTEVFAAHAQRDGLAGSPAAPSPEVVSLATLKSVSTTSTEGLAMQNRIITIDGVTFSNAGKQTLSTSGSNGVSQQFGNADGSAILYTSGYSDFYNYYCPTGTGSVTGILSCYNATWQIRLISIDGLQGFDELVKEPENGGDQPGGPTVGDGTEEKPYTVADVQGGATGTDKWVKGYIVGWIDGKSLDDGAKFDASNVSVETNILIAASKDANTVAAVVPVQLPAGDVRTALNLKAHPDNLGKEVMLKGSLEAYFGVPGVKSVSAYKIDGNGGGDNPVGPVDPVASLTQDFEGGSVPAGWSQVQVAGNKSWYVTSFQDNYYIAMTGYKGTAPFDQYLITPPIDMSKATDKVLSFDSEVNGYGSKTSSLDVYVITDPAKPAENATKLTVKLPTAPASGYSDWMSSGQVDLSSFSGIVYIAFRYSATSDANYATWCVDNVKVNVK